MKGLIVAALLALGVAGGPAAAQGTEIEGVIAAQIEAFRADDFEAAFEHASPNIKRLFGGPERFGRMVREGYPMVHRPGEVSFLALREESGRRIQRVMMRDAAGALHVLDYTMLETEAGWQIDGVTLVRGAGLA